MKDIQDLLQERIAKMLATNPSRINFYEKYQEIIHNYNNEQNRVTIEKTFEELMRLSDELTEEKKRCVRLYQPALWKCSLRKRAAPFSYYLQKKPRSLGALFVFQSRNEGNHFLSSLILAFLPRRPRR